MVRARLLGAACVAASVAGSIASAVAEAQPTFTLRGLAYDSVAGRPLPAALVTLNGVRSAFTDPRGAFRNEWLDRTLGA